MTAFMFTKGASILPPKSLLFSGGNSLTMLDADFGSISASKIAVSFWYKGSDSGMDFFTQYGASDSASSFQISSSSSGVLAASFHGSSSNTFLSTTAYSSSVWKHFLIHLDPTNATTGDRIKMWVNGVAETASSSSLTNNSTMNNSSASVTLGTNTGRIYQPAFFSGTLPAISDVYSSGPRDIRGVAGLYSYIDTTGDNITDDYKLSAAWTNNSSVTLSTDIPT